MPGMTTVSPEQVPEKQTCRIEATILDENMAPIPAASLTTLTVTLYDCTDCDNLPIVNSVDNVNILNTGRGTVDSSGRMVCTLLPADNPILLDSHEYEWRCALFRYTYSAGAKSGAHEVKFKVRNLAKIA